MDTNPDTERLTMIETAGDGGDAAGSSHSRTVELEDGAVFIMARPAKMNAITTRMLLDLEKCLDRVTARELPLLVIAADGNSAFSAGTDVAELSELPTAGKTEKCDFARSLFRRLARSNIVSVAAINGLALGGGLELALACTLRIAVPSATFSLPEIKLNLIPAYGGTQLLSAAIGPARAMEMMLTGRTLPASEAQSIGLVHRIADAGETIQSAAVRFGREVTRHDRQTINAIRKCVSAFAGEVHACGYSVEAEEVARHFGTAAASSGISAFLTRRKGETSGGAR